MNEGFLANDRLKTYIKNIVKRSEKLGQLLDGYEDHKYESYCLRILVDERWEGKKGGCVLRPLDG